MTDKEEQVYMQGRSAAAVAIANHALTYMSEEDRNMYCGWHKNTTDDLPDYLVAVVVIYNDGYCCWNHRTTDPFVDTIANGWCNIHSAKILYWKEAPHMPDI